MDLYNAVVNMLADRPFRDVVQIMQRLDQERTVITDEEPEPEKRARKKGD